VSDESNLVEEPEVEGHVNEFVEVVEEPDVEGHRLSQNVVEVVEEPDVEGHMLENPDMVE
jgi:hypothetical protein